MKLSMLLSKINFNKKCNHKLVITERSNVLQLDSMGYPLRLVIVKCKHCGYSDQIWIDVPTEEYKENETGESVLLKWK